MKWEKQGNIFDLDSKNVPGWMKSHASVPFVGNVVDGKIKVYFSSRDDNNCSNIGTFQLDIKNEYTISNISTERLLPLGELGNFDDSGIMGTCLLDDNGEQKLYYIGWNLGVTVPFRNAIGLAVSNDTVNFEKLYQGPIIDRTKSEPHFCASCCVIKENDIYKIWYLSCVKWTKDEIGVKLYEFDECIL